ncbi:MAG: hypothetical protein V3V96_17975 [Acidiferrobacterales bacterium]
MPAYRRQAAGEVNLKRAWDLRLSWVVQPTAVVPFGNGSPGVGDVNT